MAVRRALACSIANKGGEPQGDYVLGVLSDAAELLGSLWGPCVTLLQSLHVVADRLSKVCGDGTGVDEGSCA